MVHNHFVYMKTTRGLQRVDVIYRRVDDEFLDPLAFRPDSSLGVPGLYWAYRKGNVAIANAMGNGVADDKAVYCYVPDMIRYYLNEEPILKTCPPISSPTRSIASWFSARWRRWSSSAPTNRGLRDAHRQRRHRSRKWPISAPPSPPIRAASSPSPLSACRPRPSYLDGKLQPRRIDLRPFALCGPDGIDIVPGGLTRVALREGSLIVNSSQGGG
ncbi:MAG: circularly permuted type 2 ATP-grasp protein [Hymenobacter sp.]